jgi:hypothetical protein
VSPARRALLAALGAVALVFAFQAGRETAGPSGARTEPATEAQVPGGESPPEARADAALPASQIPAPASTDTVAAEAPLPPHDTPLAQILPELEARARRGDRRAACRLALDGNFCRANPVGVDAISFFEQGIARQPRTTQADIDWIAHLEAQHQRAQVMCRDLPPQWTNESVWRWMLQAAQSGDTRLAALFAISPPIRRSDFLERPEPWQQYRVHAPRLLLAAAEQGQVEAVWFLQRVLRQSQYLEGMPSAIPPDLRRSMLYMLALQPVAQGDALEELRDQAEVYRAEFDDATFAEIEREAAEFSRRHFSNVPPRDFQRGVFRDLDARHCD